MGKHRNRKRFSGPKPDPISNGKSVHPTEDQLKQVSDGSDEHVLKKIISQLQSGSSEERECGLTSLSQFDDHSGVTAIQNYKLVRVAAPLMIDKNLSVKHAAVGAIRNLSLVSAEVCEVMVEQDVMTPLCTLLATYTDDWSPAKPPKPTSESAKKNPDDVIDSKTEIFVESIRLLWNLCEAVPHVVRIINEKQILSFLLNFLNLSKFGDVIVTSVLQCIYSTTEDNPESVPVIEQREEILKPFLTAFSTTPSSLHQSILAYGILVNVSKTDGKNCHESLLPGLAKTIAQILDQDQRKMLNDFTSQTPMDDENDLKSRLDPVLENLRSGIEDTISAQQTSLEILTNLTCEDSAEDWEDDDSSDNEDMVVDIDSNTNGSTGPITALSTLPSVLVEAITSHSLTQKVLSKTVLPAENVCQILAADKYYSNFVKMVTSLRCRAFSCFNNLVQTLSMEDLGGEPALFQIWTEIGKMCFLDKVENLNSELLDSATSALRSITQKLVDSKTDIFVQALSLEDLEKMLQVGCSSLETSVRLNMVNTVGNLGVVFLESKKEHLTAIVNFLVEAATRDVELIVIAESLDKLIDLFSADETDQFCVQVNLIQRLKRLQPGLKVKINQMKIKVKKSDESFGVITMARSNLVQFIKYKEKRPIIAQALNKK